MSTYNQDAWALLDKLFTKYLAPKMASAQPKVWIPQPETCEAFWKLLQHFTPPQINVYQCFRPYQQALEAKGYLSQNTLANAELYDFIFFVPTRQRTESLGLLAESLLRLSPNGKLLFACANAQGAAGFVSRIKELLPSVEFDSGSKCKWAIISASQVTAATKESEILASWIDEAQAMQIQDTDFFTTPGIYGWNKIDSGSELLVSTLPVLTGVGADLGAGYGYLSQAVLKKSPNAQVHLVEADSRALMVAQKNLREWAPRAQFHWLDVTDGELLVTLKGLDWVIMNPPFHEGRDVESDLGIKFIEQAAKVLTPQGRIFIVANAFLPYEKVLKANFKKVEKVLEQDGFKVWHGQR